MEKLADRLSGADLTTVLLQAMRRRASNVTYKELLERHRRDRFVGPYQGFKQLRTVEDAFLAGSSDDFDWLILSPVVPLGSHSAMGFVDQNRLVSTVRNSEVAGDPTNGLALEAAVRRKELLAADPKSTTTVKLAGLQRILRGQKFDGVGSQSHFSVVGLVSAGRDTGSCRFERETIVDHIEAYVRSLRALGAQAIRVDLSIWNEDARSIDLQSADVEVSWNDKRQAGYYRDVAFKIFVVLAGVEFEVGDGGAVDWTQRLCGSAKERMVASGVGLDRLIVAGPDPGGVVTDR